MSKIAISYRRSDSQDITGRIFDRLIQRFGRETVFRDIDNILPGIDFRDQIAEALAATTVLVSIVGPRWSGQGEGAVNRIDNEADPVRIEVEMAMRRAIPVIPVLVGGAGMPAPGQLPEAIKDFAYRHANSVDGGRDFDHHVNGLIRALEYFLRREAEGPPTTSARAPAPAAPVLDETVVAAPVRVEPSVEPAHAEPEPPPLPKTSPRPAPLMTALRAAWRAVVRFFKFMTALPDRPAPIPILLFALRYIALLYGGIVLIAMIAGILGRL